MDVERVDLSLICRTCKCVAPSMKSVFNGMDNANISIQNPRIDEMLMACAAVQVNKDFSPVVDNILFTLIYYKILNIFKVNLFCCTIKMLWFELTFYYLANKISRWPSKAEIGFIWLQKNKLEFYLQNINRANVQINTFIYVIYAK